MPADFVESFLAAFAFVDNLVDKEFLMSIKCYWVGGYKGSRGKQGVVIFCERFDFGGMEDGEDVREVREIESNGGVLFICVFDNEGAVEAGHEFCNTIWVVSTQFTTSVKGREDNSVTDFERENGGLGFVGME